MMVRFLKWIGFDRSPPASLRRDQPIPDSGRRLAIEPMEDRLLLSATFSDTVSEGGTIALEIDYCPAGSPASLASPAYSSFRINATCVFDDAGDSGRWTPSTADDSQGRSLEQFSPTVTDSFESLAEEPPSAGPTGPEYIDLAEEDLAPQPPEQGMVDLTQVAYNKVFAEIGAVARTSQHGGRLTMLPGEESGTTDLFPDGQVAGRNLPGDDVKSLSGSRGRLAAFDLAMQPENIFRWRAGAEDANLSLPGSENSRSSAGVGDARPDRAALDAFSSLQQNSVEPPVPAGDAASHPAPFAGRPASPEILAGTSQSPHHQTPAQQDVAHLAPASRDDAHIDDAVIASAVSLDRSREKTATHLAMVVGIGQALMHRRAQSADTPEQEQLPPRRLEP